MSLTITEEDGYIVIDTGSGRVALKPATDEREHAQARDALNAHLSRRIKKLKESRSEDFAARLAAEAEAAKLRTQVTEARRVMERWLSIARELLAIFGGDG